MTPDQILECTDAICELPLHEQAVCALLAAEQSLSVWQRWAQRRHIEDYSKALIESFQRWLEQNELSQELNSIAHLFFQTLPIDLRMEDDPTGGYAGYALHNVAMIALDQCADVHRDIVYTGILYAAAAFCQIGHEAVWVKPDRLTKAELDFVTAWWRQCLRRFPNLRAIGKRLQGQDYERMGD
jgi:hypothetical protein